MEIKHINLIVLGSGPAGYTAALYAARSNLKPVIITGMQPGGQLTTTTDIDNWPGGTDKLQGPDLMASMLEQVKRFDVEICFDHINKAELYMKPFKLYGDQYTYVCNSLIIATGASAKYLGLPSENAYKGKGVSACATCDGFFYKGKKVAVIGGGNTAVEEALFLSDIAEQVVLVHRKAKLKADEILQDRLFEKVEQGNISILWHHVVEEILGDTKQVTGLKLRDIQKQKHTTLDLDGVFVAIGHTPNTKIFENQLAMEYGYIKVRGGIRQGATQTTIPGVFAAGDVCDPYYRQAITSAGMGCMAAIDVKSHLDSRAKESSS